MGLWVVLGTLVLATALGFALRARQGRIRAAPEAGAANEQSPALPEPVSAALSPDEPVTLVQLSTTFCAPCRHARGVLSTLAESTQGLRHVEIDITDQPHVARELGVLRTPTTLALTPQGHELLRVDGVPKTPSLRTALREWVPDLERTPRQSSQ